MTHVWCGVPCSYVWHDPSMLICLIHTCDMTHSYGYELFIRVTCPLWIDFKRTISNTLFTPRSYMLYDSFVVCCALFIRVTWPIHVDMPHSYMWHDSFIWIWIIHTCDMPFMNRLQAYYLQHTLNAKFLHLIWLVCMCDIPHSYTWHDSFILTWIIPARDMQFTHRLQEYYLEHTFHPKVLYVTWLIRIRDMPHSYMLHDSFTLTWIIPAFDMQFINRLQSRRCVRDSMGLLWWVGSIKL